MNKKWQHLIFDLDGTIIDSKGEILKTYQQVFAKFKPVIMPNLESLNYGANLNEILRYVYGNDTDLIQKAKLHFISIYDQSNYDNTDLYDGVIHTLDCLKDIKCELYIATNKRLTPTERILKNKGIRQYFTAVMANEKQPEVILRKEEMISQLKNQYSFSQGFMVGDSSSDIIAGKNQNLKTIAVTYGYENSDIFALQNPTYVIDSFNEILKIV